MLKLKKTNLILLLLLLLISYRWFLNKPSHYVSAELDDPPSSIQELYSVTKDTDPIYIIVFIGDGMGAEHRKAAQWVNVGFDGYLNMDSLPIHGWSQTASSNALITDSAAGATAIATGIRTNNGMIAMSPELVALKTVLEYAQERGLATGLVSTVQISHATPAAFASHVSSRTMMNEIALQLLENHVNVLLGGGEDEFLPYGSYGCFPEPGERLDGRNLLDEAGAIGYTTICTPEQLTALNTGETFNLIGLFGDEAMQRPYRPNLAEMTSTAIDVLKNDPQGFFLMVEGGQIDWASHNNDSLNAIQDTIDFDEAVSVGIDFVNSQPHATLIVTADHETGGMSLHLSSTGDSSEEGPFFSKEGIPFFVNWGTTGHTAANVPITALGEGGYLLDTTVPNTQIFWALTWQIFPKNYLPVLMK
ncbi:MAG: alkaline phosphatase [Anaerolineaceae bacterium]|nr:alkaline phosphatase [Anaerolineaceae bacterium]